VEVGNADLIVIKNEKKIFFGHSIPGPGIEPSLQQQLKPQQGQLQILNPLGHQGTPKNENVFVYNPHINYLLILFSEYFQSKTPLAEEPQ